MIKCQLYYCKSLANCIAPPEFTIVNMMYICKYRQFTIVKYCCVHLSLIKFFLLFIMSFVAGFSLWVVPLFMAVAPLPWLVFGRGFPVSSAPRSASPAHGLAPRPAPCGGRGLPFLRGGLSFSFCSSFSPPAQGHFRGVPSIWARAVSCRASLPPVKYYGGKFAPSIAILFSEVLFLRLLRPFAPVSV